MKINAHGGIDGWTGSEQDHADLLRINEERRRNYQSLLRVPDPELAIGHVSYYTGSDRVHRQETAAQLRACGDLLGAGWVPAGEWRGGQAQHPDGIVTYTPDDGRPCFVDFSFQIRRDEIPLEHRTVVSAEADAAVLATRAAERARALLAKCWSRDGSPADEKGFVAAQQHLELRLASAARFERDPDIETRVSRVIDRCVVDAISRGLRAKGFAADGAEMTLPACYN